MTTKRTLYQTVDKYDDEADEDPNDAPGVLQKTLLRDEYTTKNMKILFGVLLAIFVGTSLFWIFQLPSTGLLGIDVGRFVGYLAMGIAASIVIVTAISITVKSLYLGGHRAFRKAPR